LGRASRSCRRELAIAAKRVIVASKSQLVPAFVSLTFSDMPCDGDPAGPVNEAVRHGCLPFSNLYSSVMVKTVPSVMSVPKIAILIESTAAQDIFSRITRTD